MMESKVLFRPSESQVLEEEVRRHIAVTQWDKLLEALNPVYNWGRRNSIWPLQFGLACCAIEMIATAASRFDIARFGAELFRASPRQADLMIVSGTVTKKMVPMIVRLYNQMPEPKYVISMGACATGGGPFKEGYNVVSGIDKFIPVDVYIPGCPPTPQALLHGLMTLQGIITGQKIPETRWYKPEAPPEPSVPVLSADIVDVRNAGKIKEICSKPDYFPKPAAQPTRVASPKLTPTEAEGAKPRALELAARLNQAVGQGTAVASGDAVVITPAALVKAAQYLKNQPELALDFLANLTCTDYEDCYEVVYHLDSVRKPGVPVALKARAAKQEPSVPSVVSVWPGADFQEREVWDLFGVRFEGHPNLKRILLWEGFEGHPLRKDYLEPYYEAPSKIFPSRWKEGKHQRAEERNPFGRNVRYPAGFDPTGLSAEGTAAANDGEFSPVTAQSVEQLKTDTLVVNLGPQHPSTHGVFRMRVVVDGERIEALEPVMGYMHRNHEKIGERNTYLMNFPYTDRLDYLCSMGNNFGYATAVEKLQGVKPPERAEYIRVIMAELTRVLSHFWATGFLLNDLGAFFTPALYAIEERELILDLFELASGSRMMCNYFRFGGVAADLPEDFRPMAIRLVNERLPRAIDQIDRYLTRNDILMSRCRGVGVLPRDAAIAYSAAGPVLRGSGVKYDVRRAEPYSIYDRFPFEVPTFPEGDIYARYRVRIAEMRESVKILKQALKEIPIGEIQAGKKLWNIRVPAGEAYGRVENPKGELGFYVVSDGSDHPYRYHVRAPSFINLTALERMCKGHLVADVVAILGSIDIVLGETDR
ncbi:MAG: NADH-quinone oxidoreductase subunit D [Candidatus Omnitrophica bacterium]|nr:NADH-quinone oxidoreductase subunit D [Candidatus Omnitrophota bacterium]